MRILSAAALAAAVIAVSAPSQAASSDAQFAVAAAQGGLAEVQAAKLAEQRSSNPTVLAFARRMIADHTKANAQLAAIARSQGMTLPAAPDPNSAKVMAKLQTLRGAAFDSAYLKSQVNAHEQMQALLQSEVNGGKDARLVAFAKTTLSTVDQHLAMAQSDARMASSARGSGRAMMHGTAGSMSGGSMSGSSMSGGSMSGSNAANKNAPMSNGATSGGTGASSSQNGGMQNGPGQLNGSSSNANGSPANPAPRPT